MRNESRQGRGLGSYPERARFRATFPAEGTQTSTALPPHRALEPRFAATTFEIFTLLDFVTQGTHEIY